MAYKDRMNPIQNLDQHLGDLREKNFKESVVAKVFLNHLKQRLLQLVGMFSPLNLL